MVPNKKFEKEFQKNKRLYSEVAEKRTIELLGLSQKEVTIARAFETTKVVELEKLKEEMWQEQNKKLTWLDLFI